MKSKSKTFKEGTPTDEVFNWIVDSLGEYEEEYNTPRDPADWEVWLNRDVQITFKSKN